jgi:hypothetical protein
MDLRTLLGMQPQANPLQSLLGQYYNPQALQQQTLSSALTGAGLGLLSMGPSPVKPSLGSYIGAAAKGGILGGMQGQEDYKKSAIDAYSLDREKTRDEQELRDRQKAENDRMTQKKALWDYTDTIGDPSKRDFLRAFPQYGGKAMADSMFPDPNADLDRRYKEAQINALGQREDKPPPVETFYDEQGNQYKAQWNRQTQTWDKVGGSKPGDNGIVIENADGTRTIIGGSGGAKMTDAQRRAQLLTKQIVSQEKNLLSNFDSLANPRNYAGQAPGGRMIMTPQGQQAEDSLKNVLANWLYLTSGATATDAEVARQFEMIRPSPMDAPEAVAEKKARLQSIFDVMKEASGLSPSAPTTTGAGGKVITPNGKEIPWSVE